MFYKDWVVKGAFNISQFFFLSEVTEGYRLLVTEREFLGGMNQLSGRLHFLAHSSVLEDNSINGLNSEHMFKDLSIEIEVEEGSQIKRVCRLDHFGPEIAVNSVLKAFLHGKEPKPVSFG